MSQISNGNGRQSIRNPNPPIEDSVFNSLRLDGRTVIITGGCGGIGYEVARGLAEAGANVGLLPTPVLSMYLQTTVGFVVPLISECRQALSQDC